MTLCLAMGNGNPQLCGRQDTDYQIYTSMWPGMLMVTLLHLTDLAGGEVVVNTVAASCHKLLSLFVIPDFLIQTHDTFKIVVLLGFLKHPHQFIPDVIQRLVCTLI